MCTDIYSKRWQTAFSVHKIMVHPRLSFCNKYHILSIEKATILQLADFVDQPYVNVSKSDNISLVEILLIPQVPLIWAHSQHFTMITISSLYFAYSIIGLMQNDAE